MLIYIYRYVSVAWYRFPLPVLFKLGRVYAQQILLTNTSFGEVIPALRAMSMKECVAMMTAYC